MGSLANDVRQAMSCKTAVTSSGAAMLSQPSLIHKLQAGSDSQRLFWACCRIYPSEDRLWCGAKNNLRSNEALGHDSLGQWRERSSTTRGGKGDQPRYQPHASCHRLVAPPEQYRNSAQLSFPDLTSLTGSVPPYHGAMVLEPPNRSADTNTARNLLSQHWPDIPAGL
jgi:hypothetical protein